MGAGEIWIRRIPAGVPSRDYIENLLLVYHGTYESANKIIIIIINEYQAVTPSMWGFMYVHSHKSKGEGPRKRHT